MRYLDEALPWYQWPPEALHTLLRQSDRMLLLLDGLDEIFDPVIRDGALQDIQRFSHDYPQVQIVVTSRVVGYKRNRLRDAGFHHVMLQDLSLGTDDNPGQIDDFLGRWHDATFEDPRAADAKRQRLRNAIAGSKQIAELAGNPLLLTMMAILNRHQELPRDRADLYAQAARVLLYQWDTERALSAFPGLSADIGFREKDDMLRRIASHMQNAAPGLAGNIIDGTTLTTLIETYLYTELRFAQARAAARAVVDHLRERNFILCFLGADSYAFVHRTFLDYFCAKDIVYRINIEHSVDKDGFAALVAQHRRDDDWREVLRLACGQLNHQFVACAVEALIEGLDLTFWDGTSALPEVPLAIWCLSESRQPNTLADIGGRVLMLAAGCFLESSSLPEAFINQLLAAATDLGPRWPGKSAFTFTGQYPRALLHVQCTGWPAFLGIVFQERAWLRELSECRSGSVRYGAFVYLGETWPDEVTRAWQIKRGLEDSESLNRSLTLSILAQNWPDDQTRALVTKSAFREEEPYLVSLRLSILVGTWHDDLSREQVTRHAHRARRADSRCGALAALAKARPDARTRAFIQQRAARDREEAVRQKALEELLKIWPDEATWAFIARRARIDGYAATLLAGTRSEFGRIVFSCKLDGKEPYLDVRQPIPLLHLIEAAETAGVPDDEVLPTIDAVFDLLGWDFSRGSRPRRRARVA